MKKKMHLVGFRLHCPMNHTILSWAHPRGQVGYEGTEPEFWQEITRALERGKFDCLFLADQLAAFDTYQGSMDAMLRYVIQFPIHDALLVVPAKSAVTERLGFGVTATTTYAPGSFHEVVDGLVPVLQKRGLHRTAYSGRTLREHLRAY